jgi:hypothetical protein
LFVWIVKHFFSFWPFLRHQCITFSFFVQIEQFKLLWNRHLKFYKWCFDSKGNRIIFKDFLNGSRKGYELFNREFSIKTTPPSLKGHKVFASSLFLLIFSMIDVQRRGLHLFIGHHKKWGPPAKMARNLTLSVLWPTSLP